MRKIEPAVWKETRYIAVTTLLLEAAMQAVFLTVGKWSLSVLFGGLYGWAVALGNFFLMALTVQKAVGQDAKSAQSTMKLSQGLRLIGMFLLALVAYLIPSLHTLAAILPYLFPRIAIFLSPFLRKQ